MTKQDRLTETARDMVEQLYPVLHALVHCHAALRMICHWHGGFHEDDCPVDDTCDCKWKPLNQAINQAIDGAVAAIADPGPMPAGEGAANKLRLAETKAADLRGLLKEVMEWVDNWAPNFTEDEEWQELGQRAHAAVKEEWDDQEKERE